MNIKGVIKDIGKKQTKSNFSFRKLILTTLERYPQTLSIDFVQNNCELLDGYNINDDVEVAYNLRGREWKTDGGEVRYFNTIVGWKIQPLQREVTASDQSPDRDDDLPF